MKKLLTVITLGLSLISFAGPRKALDEATKSQLIKVLEKNEALHASFFEYKGEEVEKNAKELINAISEVKNEEVAKLLKFSSEKLATLTKDEDRQKNNDTYGLFSAALVHVVNTYDVGEGYNAYQCPMVKKKWVQNSKKMNKVHNPYAPEMPNCGGKITRF
ncbi:PF11827 family protein [Bacteriovorax sp. BSW11_IV]|uniref:DUF3347 domain-containing protein n=1 Tax=Bacteriovorax sp. BSW11_IV TaxID=1353529 RepID=UPI00038A0605|nr:DUF3347 domain-containing protein [Bacteriovorax sp. BSW11_IV]EQC42933.1 PF11827 family protein [Bacteriovorax sp. BSW11_IV]